MPVIHLVDDDTDVTDSCQFLLETLGYNVTVWNDSEQFIQQALCMRKALYCSICACQNLMVVKYINT